MDNEIMKKEGRRLFKAGYFVLIVLGIFLVIETLGAFKYWQTPDLAVNNISVTGKGEAVAVPDVSTFSFSVSADAKNVSDAQGSVTTKMDAILADLKKLGIEDKDIKTTDYSVFPKYSYIQSPCSANGMMCPPSRQVTDGYTVSHSVLVKVRKVSDAGKALASVGDKGATNISGITFTTDDPDKALTEARAAAITDAKVKAEELAKNLGVTLVRIIGYSDNSASPVPYGIDGGISMMKTAGVQAPTLPVGENKVTANVTVTYEIR